MQILVSRKPMLNCEDTATLISLARGHRIGLWRKVQIHFHNAFCEACSKYYKFVERIGKKIRSDASAEPMPAAMRAALKRKLKL